MATPEDLTPAVCNCVAFGMTFPPRTEPGLPQFAYAALTANYNAVMRCPPFLPPIQPEILNLTIAPLSFFEPPFIGMPPDLPFDKSAETKLIRVVQKQAYEVAKKFVEDLWTEEIIIPVYADVLGWYNTFLAEDGLGGDSAQKFGECLSDAIVTLYDTNIPQ